MSDEERFTREHKYKPLDLESVEPTEHLYNNQEPPTEGVKAIPLEERPEIEVEELPSPNTGGFSPHPQQESPDLAGEKGVKSPEEEPKVEKFLKGLDNIFLRRGNNPSETGKKPEVTGAEIAAVAATVGAGKTPTPTRGGKSVASPATGAKTVGGKRKLSLEIPERNLPEQELPEDSHFLSNGERWVNENSEIITKAKKRLLDSSMGGVAPIGKFLTSNETLYSGNGGSREQRKSLHDLLLIGGYPDDPIEKNIVKFNGAPAESYGAYGNATNEWVSKLKNNMYGEGKVAYDEGKIDRQQEIAYSNKTFIGNADRQAIFRKLLDDGVFTEEELRQAVGAAYSKKYEGMSEEELEAAVDSRIEWLKSGELGKEPIDPRLAFHIKQIRDKGGELTFAGAVAVVAFGGKGMDKEKACKTVEELFPWGNIKSYKDKVRLGPEYVMTVGNVRKAQQECNKDRGV